MCWGSLNFWPPFLPNLTPLTKFMRSFESYCTPWSSDHNFRAKEYNQIDSFKYWHTLFRRSVGKYKIRIYFVQEEGDGQFEYLLNRKNLLLLGYMHHWPPKTIKTFKITAFHFLRYSQTPIMCWKFLEIVVSAPVTTHVKVLFLSRSNTQNFLFSNFYFQNGFQEYFLKHYTRKKLDGLPIHCL